MNRRNFILGLGTAATLSGAASVTGAAINESVSPSANFQVIAEQNLDVRRNGGLDTVGGNIDNSSYDNYVNSTVDYVGPEGTFSGDNATDSGAGDVAGPRLTVNNQTDGDLSMALASPNDATIAANNNGSNGLSGTPDDPYGGSSSAPLEVVNQGGSTVEVTVDYNYGADVNSTDEGGSIPPEDIAQLFTFSIPDSQDSVPSGEGGQISPSTSAPEAEGDDQNNNAQIESGQTAYVNFNINYSEAIEEEIAAAAGDGYGFGSGSTSAVDLLDSVSFGTTGNQGGA
jgi:hypothetical protein